MRTLSVLYLFAGEDRKASIKGAIVDIARVWAPCIGVDFLELDVCQGGAEHDLSDPERQADIVDQVRRGAWHWVILSPPCNTWSRAVWSNPQGPRPVRSYRYPLGFPWLSRADRAKAELGNCLALFAARVAAAACEASVRKHFVRFTLEHPEDLGATPRGSPASIWQLDEVRRLTELGAHAVSFAFWQCFFGPDYPKPTRIVGNIIGLEASGHQGWPTFEAGRQYSGPLPAQCGHRHARRLTGRRPNGSFQTSGTAAYPAAMNN